MDVGEVTALVTVVGGLLTAFGAGDLVPYVGPAVQGVLALVTFGAAIYSFWSHRQKNTALAGVR